MCHFHQKRIINRYITLRPKLEASQKLKKIVARLKYSNEERFTKALDIWHIKYKDFLDEITIHPDTGNQSFTHKKLVAAHRSLRRNLPYLSTTNSLEGGVFSPLKILIKIHRGLSKSLKLKIVDDYLLNYKKN